MYSAGQALCVGIGSVSHTRPLRDSIHYWSSRAFLEEAKDSRDFLAREEHGLLGISQTAYMRYFEVKHGLDIQERYLFFDGPLVHEWLTATHEGLTLYKQLFSCDKRAIGVIKSIKANAVFAKYAKALRTGEIYVHETLADHLEGLSSGANSGEWRERNRFTSGAFLRDTAGNVWRGVFKPAKKAFAFECHANHLQDMLRVLAADCQLNYLGHEVPYLLNRIEEEVKGNFRPSILRDRIAGRLAMQSEELFLEEGDEGVFRHGYFARRSSLE
jgi:hypothetical protein